MKQLNLLPWRINRRRKAYREMALCFLLPLLVASFSLLCVNKHEQAIAQSFLQVRNKLATELSKLRAKQEQSVMLKQIGSSQNQLLNLLIYMGSLLPKNSSLLEWQYQDQSMQWNGRVLDNTSAQLLAKNLAAIPFLQSVHIKQITDHNFAIQADYVDTLR
ncbi:MAG: hypothetical protein K0R66_298 [Gammaproteobacteria bacterium]|jgi:hypothetical protein|nr:hypothetical protein [Gammaproteobacteria bacterium]